MQNIGFVFCLYPALKRLFPDQEMRKLAASRNLQPVNTHPSMGPLLAGLTARLEHDLDPEVVIPYRRSVMSSLAAHGDHIFWGNIKPLAAILGVIVTLFFWGSVAGGLVLIVVYNVPNLLARSQGFRKGWTEGLDFLKVLHSQAVDRAVMAARGAMALVLGVAAGLLIFSAMTSQQFSVSEVRGWICGMMVFVLGVAGLLMIRKQIPLGVVIYVVSLGALMMFILLEAGTRLL